MKTRLIIIMLSTLLYGTCGFGANIVKISSDTGFNKPFIIPHAVTILNGHKTPLMIDLGASMGDVDIILKKKAAHRLGIKGHAPKTCAYSQSGITCYLTTSIENIKIGNRTYHNLKGLIALKDWGGATFYKNIKKGKSYKNGVITLAFLKKFNVFFNFNNHTMVLLNKNEFPPQYIYQHTPMPFTINNGVNTTLSINDQKLHLIWDTALMPSILDNTKIPPSKTTRCSTKYDAFSKAPQCLSLNTTQLQNRFMVCNTKLPPQAKIDGVVGSDYFYTHKVFIDFTNYLIYTT